MSRLKVLITLILSAVTIIAAFSWLIGSDACQTPVQNVVALIAMIIAVLVAADAIERAGDE